MRPISGRSSIYNTFPIPPLYPILHSAQGLPYIHLVYNEYYCTCIILQLNNILIVFWFTPSICRASYGVWSIMIWTALINSTAIFFCGFTGLTLYSILQIDHGNNCPILLSINAPQQINILQIHVLVQIPSKILARYLARILARSQGLHDLDLNLQPGNLNIFD